MNKIDTSKDMGADAPLNAKGERYGEGYCKTLHDYHEILWSKELPSGTVFTLKSVQSDTDPPYFQLHHSSELGKFIFTSDWTCNTYLDRWNWMPEIRKIITELRRAEKEQFNTISTKIGNYIVFPKGTKDPDPVPKPYDRYKSKTTWGINSARGLDEKICDRFDLTLECIRLWYSDIKDAEQNPLAVALDYSKEFLKLFESFPTYVKYFLLDDLVDSEYSNVEFWLPFYGFNNSEHKPLPQNLEEYRKYISAVTGFINARNSRIEKWDKAPKEA